MRSTRLDPMAGDLEVAEQARVFLRLAGGLGNQLFQVAYGMHVADRLNAGLVYSDSDLNKYASVHDYVLHRVIDLHRAEKSDVYSRYLAPLRLPKLFRFRSRQLALVSDQNATEFLDKAIGRLACLDGYFQDVPLELLGVLPLRPEFLALKGKVKPADVVIHVRGRDFLSLGFTDTGVDRFYAEALSRMSELVEFTRPVIVTDDPRFVSQLRSLRGMEICNQGVVEEFAQLCFTRNRVFSSSTFAIAAAAVGDRTGVNVSSGTWMKGNARSYLLPNEIVIGRGAHEFNDDHKD